MTTGGYANGGDGAQDLQMGLLGMANAADSSDGEGSFSVAAAFFPYAQGWIGATCSALAPVSGLPASRPLMRQLEAPCSTRTR